MMFGVSCDRAESGPPRKLPAPAVDLEYADDVTSATAVLAGGCFWCVEAPLEMLDGVTDVVSGYAGGTAETADYRTVCTGRTDHAEVVKVTFDPRRVGYGEILRVFFTIHDPTQLNRQGNDIGRQYRSAVFYESDDEKRVAEAYIAQLNQSGLFEAGDAFGDPLATTLEPLDTFYPAEAYHQDYVVNNPSQPYVVGVALPKLAKLKATYPEKLRDE